MTTTHLNGGHKKDVHSFGQILKELRTARSLSQGALAQRSKVSAGYVGLIEIGERGERPSLDIVKRFGQAVNATLEEMEALMRASGHLEEGESLIPNGRPTFAQFVNSDPLLSRGQKDVLLSVYDSWV